MGVTASYKHLSLDELEKLKNNHDAFTADLGSLKNAIDIDKNWEAILFVLTRTVIPDLLPEHDEILGRAVISNRRNLIDNEYYIFYLTPEEVKESAEALAGISKEDFAKLYETASKLEKTSAANDFGAQGVYYLNLKYQSNYYEIFEILVNYYKEAATQNHAMLISIV